MNMPNISIKGKEYQYDERDVILFTEGLIGLPGMRRAVLIPMAEYAPFCWLASTEDERNRFIVVDPTLIYADYQPRMPEIFDGTDLKLLVIVKISSDWEQTTVNLRAPLFINPEAKKGAQVILSESRYGLAESLPLN
ncbi:MAG: flagellar assembly protein FliW [Pyrinomonadaceae bacterium]